MNGHDFSHSGVNFIPGQRIAERFEIVRPLREGCQGAIYLVRHIDFPERLIAMKILLLNEDEDFDVTAARFRNEVMAAYSVTHPNVVRIFDYIREGQLLAFTMEYVIGGDLADLLAYDEPLKIYQIVHILEQVCSGLHAIHEANIIHRDIKPENILITKDGQVKISDFGTARVGSTISRKGGITGTVAYLSPEYVKDGILDFRSDLYSLGIVAFEMVAGETPFHGENLLEMMSHRLQKKAPSVLETNKDCPELLAKIVERLLELDPANRYQTASQVLEDLAKVRVKKATAQGNENLARTQIITMDTSAREEALIPPIPLRTNTSSKPKPKKVNNESEEISSTRLDIELDLRRRQPTWTDTMHDYVVPPVTSWQYITIGLLTVVGFVIGLIVSRINDVEVEIPAKPEVVFEAEKTEVIEEIKVSEQLVPLEDIKPSDEKLNDELIQKIEPPVKIEKKTSKK